MLHTVYVGKWKISFAGTSTRALHWHKLRQIWCFTLARNAYTYIIKFERKGKKMSSRVWEIYYFNAYYVYASSAKMPTRIMYLADSQSYHLGLRLRTSHTASVTWEHTLYILFTISRNYCKNEASTVLHLERAKLRRRDFCNRCRKSSRRQVCRN